MSYKALRHMTMDRAGDAHLYMLTQRTTDGFFYFYHLVNGSVQSKTNLGKDEAEAITNFDQTVRETLNS